MRLGYMVVNHTTGEVIPFEEWNSYLEYKVALLELDNFESQEIPIKMRTCNVTDTNNLLY